MSEVEQALAHFPARSPETILNRLFEMRKRARRGEAVRVPCMTLSLTNGERVQGWVLDIATEKNETFVAMQAAECDEPPRPDVFYVSLRRIDAVTVHDAASYAPDLSFGAVQRAPGAPAPTKMALRRRAAALAEGVLGAQATIEIDFADDASEDSRFVLSQALEMLGGILTEITQDAIGRAALQSLVMIRLQFGETYQVARDGSSLLVGLKPTEALPPRETLADDLAALL